MNRFVRAFCFVAVVACAVHAADEEVAPGQLSDDVVESYRQAYEVYQVKFDKHYDTQEEYEKHLRAYAASMENVKIWTKKYADRGMKFGETSRSDLLEEEKKTLGVRIPTSVFDKQKRAYNTNSFPQPQKATQLGHTANNVPTEFNWFNVSGVKHNARNQGACGSCWAFSAMGQLEMQAALEGLSFIDTSRQHAIDCVTSSTTQGCCGGWPGDVYDQVTSFVSDENYPYQMASGYSSCNQYSCRSSGKPTISWQINGYDSFKPMAASELKKQIWMYGPISIWMNAPNMMSGYTGGILDCTGLNPNGGAHYVVAVGFGSNFITLRNSWGPNWGLQGDFMLSTDSDEASCQLLEDRGYLQLARVSVVPEQITQCTSGVCCDTSTGLFRPNTYVCRAKSGDCDIAEYCTGSSASCPDDKFASAGTVCNAASGPCENDAKCTGSSKTCPSKTFKSSSTVCRAKNGDCDVAEYCTGSNAACPADIFIASGTVCSRASGACENDAYCTGNSSTCPTKIYKSSSTVCRAKNGACDVAEYCTGLSATCPADQFAASGTVCSAASGLCENDAVCTGSSKACPSKTFKSSGIICDSSSGPCENDAKCTGNSSTCPAKTYKSSNTVCRAKNGDCDVAEYCTGSSAPCPSDAYVPSTTVCHAASGPCENDAYCTGNSGTCPTKTYKSSITVCNLASGPCENDAYCTGSSAICPSKTYKPSGTLCSKPCESDAYCTGRSNTCPSRTLKPSGTICRAKNGDCDVAEYCTGSDAECPDDEFATAGTVCNSASGVCENDAVCSGNSGICPSKTFKSSNTVCRAKNGDCDVAEYCTGSSAECPYDKNASSTTTCYAIVGNCRSLTYCSGISKSCVADEESLDMWENQSNGCIEYYCDNETGLQATLKCQSEEICVNGECVREEEEDKEVYAIRIDMNTTELISVTPSDIAKELSKMSGVNVEDMTIAFEYDREGRVKCIIVYVGSESQAKKLTEAINGMNKNEDTCEGVLCHSSNAQMRTRVPELSLEEAFKHHVETILLALTLCIILFIL